LIVLIEIFCANWFVVLCYCALPVVVTTTLADSTRTLNSWSHQDDIV